MTSTARLWVSIKTMKPPIIVVVVVDVLGVDVVDVPEPTVVEVEVLDVELVVALGLGNVVTFRHAETDPPVVWFTVAQMV